MKRYLFFSPIQILCLLLSLFPQKTICSGERRPLIGFTYSVNYDSLFSILSLNSMFSFCSINSLIPKKIDGETTSKIAQYLSITTWPAVKRGSRELITEVSAELAPAAISTIKKIFISAAGLAFVITGGQIFKQALLTTKKKKPAHKKKLSQNTILVAIGSGMILSGIGAILFCDSIVR